MTLEFRKYLMKSKHSELNNFGDHSKKVVNGVISFLIFSSKVSIGGEWGHTQNTFARNLAPCA